VVIHAPRTDQVGLSVPLSQTVRIGRSRTCELRLDDAQSSRVHARIVVAAGAFVLEDQGSRHGCSVNGAPVHSPAPLAAGDVIRVGRSLLMVDRAVEDRASKSPLLGISSAIANVRAQLGRVARSTLAVRLMGETGTGKELAATMVHDLSGRRGRFVAVNCATLPSNLAESALFGHVRGAFTGAVANRKGVFEEADGGTLFLDELGDLSPEVQPRLLRVLEDGVIVPLGGSRPVRVDVRLVSATHQRLGKETFRGDLLARIDEWPLTLPPLRERRGDIPLLACTFLHQASPGRGFTAEALETLATHRWPANVRELRSLCRWLAVAVDDSDVIERHHIVARLQAEGADAAPVDRPTTPVADLRSLLRRHGGNVAEVARQVGVSRKTLYKRLREESIDLVDFRTDDSGREH